MQLDTVRAPDAPHFAHLFPTVLVLVLWPAQNVRLSLEGNGVQRFSLCCQSKSSPRAADIRK